MLFDLFLQILDLLFDLVEYVPVDSANGLTVGFFQSVLRPGFLLHQRFTRLPKSCSLVKHAELEQTNWQAANSLMEGL
ncbi:hypothetical protein GGP55_003114 [Salinibacter ruber]|uniref:hypothetical protein n=1 Tax=Salinibacter ruber TaxID=146919 RepID=UPI002168252E|nr:hypothetical protein [Salinibacter ruber]MCS3632496.1 hypothetical protein [Salinibacter ruber]